MSRRLIVALLALAIATPAAAAPGKITKRSTKAAKPTTKSTRKVSNPEKRGAAARVTFARAGELRTTKDVVVGRREEPLTLEEQTAADIAKLLRSPGLRNGVTGLFVADAKTGEPLFAVNAEDSFNPASNVKMISTATALDLLGPDFRYPTRLLGPQPVGGVVKGDVYLLGSHDPTLTSSDLEDIAAELDRRGITSIEGGIVVGTDPTRDGIFRAIVPVDIRAGAPGAAPTFAQPVGTEHVTVVVTAKTNKKKQRARLTYKTETITEAGKASRIVLTVGGTIGKDGSARYPLWTRERTTTAAFALRAALHARNIAISGDMKMMELGDFVGDTVAAGGVPVELGRHESRKLSDIVARINKWSVNWLADRVVMTAAALARQEPPSMKIALEEMYAWLARHPHLATKDVVLDTGSGLSYKTQISPTDLVAIIRSAAGFAGGTDGHVAQAWVDSLAIARTDGTLRSRLRGTAQPARVRGKTGTLSTVIAVSGILDIDPNRPLAFSLVTNTDVPLSKVRVRQAHDKVLGLLSSYVAKTTLVTPAAVAEPPPVVYETQPPPEAADEAASDAALDSDTTLDAEAAGLAAPS